jgi:signal transduction histidine kinase
MLWLVLRLYREATHEIAKRGEAEVLRPQTARTGLFLPVQKLGWPRSGSHRSPLLLTISLAIVIAAVEMLDMLLLQFLPPLSVHVEALVDSAFLVLMVSPALYFIFFRPLLRQFIIREQAEEALKQLNLELENRVEQRTAQLRTELAERKRVAESLAEHQKQLRSLSSELSLVEERERRRIALDLHDGIGQTLALVNNQLGILRASISAKQGEELLDDIKDLVGKAIRYSRSLTSELRSPIFDQLPFGPAVEWLAEDILEKNLIATHLKVGDGSQALADDTRVLVLKAIRELLVNVVKHAKARNVKISVRTEVDDIIIEIKDDGIGFDVPEDFIPSPGRKGLGLFTVRERLTHLNGRFSITSKPGQGTSSTLTVPKQKQAEEGP